MLNLINNRFKTIYYIKYSMTHLYIKNIANKCPIIVWNVNDSVI